MNELAFALREYPYLLIDFSFVVLAALFAVMPRGGCSYRISNLLLSGQLLTAIGFSTSYIALQIIYGSDLVYDGLGFYGFMCAIYFTFYWLISKTGDKFQGLLSLIIGGYHFAIFAGILISFEINEYLGVKYENVMVLLTIMQLLLAFRGGLYGAKFRFDNAHCWSSRNRNHHI